ncbi:MAG: DUF2357 domain-containing protein [Phormidium sp. PBR-2020]|nr:MAG: DUF2357 domain-containing protein [Phormidium sp. PBR-2020]
MLIYPSLADYLQNQSQSFEPGMTLRLRGRDRPIFVLESPEKFPDSYNFLMKRGENLYEVGFPWIQIADWESQKTLSQDLTVEIDPLGTLHIVLEDEVFDETQLNNDEKTAELLQDVLGKACDRVTAETISIFVGFFNLLRRQQQGKIKNCPVLQIPYSLAEASQTEARLPLVLALERRYELRQKLQLITSKLRSQLNRQAESIPLGRIQEMDGYCLRDYIRRPGGTAAEKAGARQELMGIKRHQNFNTPENRFLVGFCDLIHLDCHDYRDEYSEAKALKNAIHRFRQDPTVQTIPHRRTFIGKPNYVLQQNPIYRSFYQAYLDYLKRRTETEKLWSVRQGLLLDITMMLLVAGLLHLEGSYVSPIHEIKVRDTPRRGHYLNMLSDWGLEVSCFLQESVLRFHISPSSNPTEGDLKLQVAQQFLDLDPQSEQLFRQGTLPIWVFWYKPSPEIRQKFTNYRSPTQALYLYLYDNFDDSDCEPLQGDWLQLAHPLNEGLDLGSRQLCEEICQRLGRR